ncbi:MAG TPA: GAF domain-containing protein, partial [Anaerolineales bacterium]|nr:GAF domain-containing protein [Anaerolineales bacterium]
MAKKASPVEGAINKTIRSETGSGRKQKNGKPGAVHKPSRRKAAPETRKPSLKEQRVQREAELAIINSVQEGLASKLGIRAIYELVGEKVREIFHADTTYINTYNPADQSVYSQYYVDKGQRIIRTDPLPFGVGLYTKVIQIRQPVLTRTREEQLELGAMPASSPNSEEDLNQSYLGVPILLDDEVTGVISVQAYEENAFTERDVRLLQTLANSMSVALENARLFDETQRLLRETEQRNAELAIINSVQQGLASKLEMQDIYDLVGDKVREIFDSQSVLIVKYDHANELSHIVYNLEKGQRFYTKPYPFTGLHRELIRTGQTILIDENADAYQEKWGMRLLPGTERSKSMLFVPLNSGNGVYGTISLQNIEKEHAFSDSDVRLLETLASSMSVALENARLFDETQRLLKETEQRAAELAIINSVQQGLASKLDYQGIIELVGDKIREIFNAQAINIAKYDAATELFTPLYLVERNVRHSLDAMEPGPIYRHIVNTHESLRFNTTAELNAIGATIVPGTENTQSGIYAPLIQGGQFMGVIALENLDHENAFTESDLRLLTTLASSMSVALENARLFDETQRLLRETEQRAHELAAISTVSQALVMETELDNMIQLIGNQMQQIFEADIVYVALLDPQTNTIRFPYQAGDTFEALKLGEGLTSRIIRSGKPLLLNRDIRERRAQMGTPLLGREALSYLGVPIKSGREAIGVLSVQSTTSEDRFDEDDLRLLTTIAANAGAAIQTARLHAETQRRAQEMATLAEIGNDIAASRDLEPVLERIASHAKAILRVRDIAILLREPDSQTFHTAVALGRYVDQMMAFEIEPGRGLSGHILQSGVPEFVNDPTSDPRVAHIPGTPLVEEEKECLMGAPLTSRGEVIGGIMVWRGHSEGLFTQADLDFLVSVARQTAIAIESARLYLETQRRAREMSVLVDVGRDISASLEAKTVLESIASHARDLLKGTLSALFLPEQDGHIFRAIAAVGEEAEQLRNDTINLGEGLLGNVARTKAGEIINYASADPRTVLIAGTQEHPDEHLIAVPLLASEELKGLMAVWRRGRGNEFNEAELEFLRGLARQAVIAVQNSQLFT